MYKRPSNACGMFDLFCRASYWKRRGLCACRPTPYEVLCRNIPCFPGWGSEKGCSASTVFFCLSGFAHIGLTHVGRIAFKAPQVFCPSLKFLQIHPPLDMKRAGPRYVLKWERPGKPSSIQTIQKLMVGEFSSLRQAHVQSASCMAQAGRILPQKSCRRERGSRKGSRKGPTVLINKPTSREESFHHSSCFQKR